MHRAALDVLETIGLCDPIPSCVEVTEDSLSVEAIRDAGARIAIEWPKQDYVLEWINQFVLDRNGKAVM